MHHRTQLPQCQKNEIASVKHTKADARSVAEIQATINNINSYLYF